MNLQNIERKDDTNAHNDTEILELWKKGNKLAAVKLRKEISGSSLKEAKIYVEELCKRNGIQADTPSKGSSSNCFVITATLGDPNHPIVDEFRLYRDSKLLPNAFGRSFVQFYYKVGPYLAAIISKNVFLRKISFSLFVHPIYKRLIKDRKTNKN